VQEYLDAYDQQLRTDAETPSAVGVTRLGPLRLVTFAGGRGFVTYRDLRGADSATIARWVEGALAHYREDPVITRLEWKTRAHDRAPGLHDAPLPKEIHLPRVTSEPDVRALSVMQEEAYGGGFAEEMTDALLRRLGFGDGMELWVAEADGPIVGSGRLEPVPATEFAGIWGGATRPDGRRRGIYRALPGARARSALALGKRLIHSDSTEHSRPILERAGLSKVSTTTPYLWVAGE
jgi:GNAT superfamily N-acetyltransferase